VGAAALYGIFGRAIDVPAWRAYVLGAPPEVHAWLWPALVGSWAIGMHLLLRPVLFDRTLAWTWRMPWGPRQWALALLPVAWVACAPCAAFAWVLPGAWAWAQGVVLMSVAGGVFVLWATHTGAGAILGAAPLAALAAGPWVAASEQAVWFVIAAFGVPGSSVLMGWAYCRLHGAGLDARSVRVSLPPMSRVRAAYAWDVRCLWRTSRELGAGWLVQATLSAAFTFAVARHGGDVAITASVFAAAVSPWSLVMMGRLREQLGPWWFSGRIPMTATERAGSLFASLGLPCIALACACVVAGGGVSGLDILRLFVLCVAVTATQIAAGAWVWRRENAALYPMFGVLMLWFWMLAPWWAQLAFHGAWASLMVMAAGRGLERGRRAYGGAV